MSKPTAVFLDTSIFDRYHYNFSASALTTLSAACKAEGVSLLLPDPTEREIRRHIKRLSTEALGALASARRKAPFLEKWRHFPPEIKSPHGTEWEVHRLATAEWQRYLREFALVRLDYDLLHVPTVMQRYDRAEPPFQDGRKKSEFPDAFALAMLEAYAQRQQCYVAIVSHDRDFALACNRTASLLYSDSAPRFTELLLAHDERLGKCRKSIEAHLHLFDEAVVEAVQELLFVHKDERYEVTEFTMGVLEVQDPTVVALGSEQCTVVFDAVFSVDLQLRFEENDWDWEWRTADVRDMIEIAGTAKVSFSSTPERTPTVTHLVLDRNEVVVTSVP